MLFGRREEYARNRRYILLATYSGGVSANLIGGNFLTGLLLLMNASDSYIGLVTMTVMFGNMLQVFSPLLLDKFRERKRILLTGRVIVHFMNIVLISVIPLFSAADALKLAMILVVVLLVNVTNAMLVRIPGLAYKAFPTRCAHAIFLYSDYQQHHSIYGGSAVQPGGGCLQYKGYELTGLLLLRGLAWCFRYWIYTICRKYGNIRLQPEMSE